MADNKNIDTLRKAIESLEEMMKNEETMKKEIENKDALIESLRNKFFMLREEYEKFKANPGIINDAYKKELMKTEGELNELRKKYDDIKGKYEYIINYLSENHKDILDKITK